MDLEVLRNITYGMYIITSNFDDELAGCVVNTITQITSNDPIVSISVNKDNFTNKIIKKSKKVAISILFTETSKDTIVNFGYKSGQNYNKFLDNNIYKLDNDLPIITDNVCGYIIGDVINIIDCETHDIFLIRIKELKKGEDLNPMTYQYYQTNLKGTSPKNAPTYVKKEADGGFGRYECIVCGYIYDESIEKIKFEELPDDWKCPTCGVVKEKFRKIN